MTRLLTLQMPPAARSGATPGPDAPRPAVPAGSQTVTRSVAASQLRGACAVMAARPYDGG